MFITTSVVLLMSFSLVYLIRHFCFRYNILDIPNHRSSHKQPTALMGGIGFVTAFVAGYGLLLYTGLTSYSNQFFVILLSALFIATASLVDDIKRLGAGKRFLVHLAAATAVYAVGMRLNIIALPFIGLELSAINYFLTIVFIVAMTNIYNFMDGIDGYAGGVGVLGSLALGYLAFLTQQPDTGRLLLVMAAAITGFLVWNYPKAKIFMGDVGSAFLGFIFAVFSLMLTQGGESDISILVPMMIFGVFIMDASVTMIRRVLRGEKVWEAHRSHFYQRLNILGWPHQRIIWMEYAHMLLSILIAIAYMHATDLFQLMLLLIFLVTYAAKFVWITKLENNRPTTR